MCYNRLSENKASDRKEKEPSLSFLEIRKDHKAGDKLDELIKVE